VNKKPEEPESTNLISESEVEEWFESEDTPPEATAADKDADKDIVQRYSDAQLRIVRSTMDLSLHSLRQSLRDSTYINVHPGYQRRHRWDTKKRSQLIESLLLNIPIPPLFLFENDYNQYEVMDGRQRLDAVSGFLDNTYSLRGLEYWPELDGSNFAELPPTIQRGLLRRTITAIVLLAETSRPEESEIDVRMALFKRLNTGGVKLNPQELRNALYPSDFNSMLIAVSKWDVFRDSWGIPKYTSEEEEKVPKRLQANALYKTMADCELVLRFFAIRETVLNNRRGSLRGLMDKSMRQHRSDDRATIERLDREYRHALKYLYDTFDGHPFVLPQTNRPSRPVYDALMVASAIVGTSAPAGRKSPIQSNFSKAANDPRLYEVMVGRGNTVDAIKERVELAKKILTE
jgi:hypothetical protein